MTVPYAVTFEFETRPPVTARGTVTASSTATCVARATRSAQKALRPVGWSSVVCVLLERLGEPEQTADAVDPSIPNTGKPPTRAATFRKGRKVA